MQEQRNLRDTKIEINTRQQENGWHEKEGCGVITNFSDKVNRLLASSEEVSTLVPPPTPHSVP